MTYAVHLSDHRSEPTVGAECYEATWSQGRSCAKCNATCYRAGWEDDRVRLDNVRLVQLKGEGVTDGRL